MTPLSAKTQLTFPIMTKTLIIETKVTQLIHRHLTEKKESLLQKMKKEGRMQVE